ncbi:MAG TPA: GDSL-type esterase/lipase family protein [Stellaceae bacterium]
MKWRLSGALSFPLVLATATGLAAAEPALPPPPPASGPPACAVPTELMVVDGKLPHLAARLHTGGPVKIVAIGGASTAGLAAGSPDFAYPHRLQEILARFYPPVAITVLNEGAPRQSAQQMLDRFPRDVFAERPVLVIWETGTTDAVRGIETEEFAATLQSGIEAIEAHGADVILVDPQFSHRISAVIDFDRYLKALNRVADVNDLYVFPRYEMMRYWSEQNVFNFDGVAKDGRAGFAAKVYECLGYRLAEAIRTALQ